MGRYTVVIPVAEIVWATDGQISGFSVIYNVEGVDITILAKKDKLEPNSPSKLLNNNFLNAISFVFGVGTNLNQKKRDWSGQFSFRHLDKVTHESETS